MTEEYPRRWRLHLRKLAEQPFDTMHVYHWIEREPGTICTADDEEEPFTILRTPALIELIHHYLVPPSSLAPLEFADKSFDAYREDRDQRPQPSVAAYIADTFQHAEITLPPSLVSTLAELPNNAVYLGFLARHAAYVADALKQFEIPHDRGEVIRMLTGESLIFGELEQSSGNMLRFLRHLGLAPDIERKLVGRYVIPGEELRENPATEVVEAAGALPLYEIEAGPFFVPLAEVFLLIRCVSYRDNRTECVARMWSDKPLERPSAWIPPYAAYTSMSDGFCLFVGNGPHQCAHNERCRLGGLLRHLPPDARLELLLNGAYERMRLSGQVEGDQWRLEAASVPLANDDMDEILALFRTAEARRPQVMRDDREMEAILLASSGHSVFYKTPPRREGLALLPREAAEAESIGQLLFRHRFGHRWNFSAFDLRQVDLLKRVKALDSKTAREFAQPASKQMVLDGQASRFYQADSSTRAMERDMRNAAQNFKHVDETMAALGFTCAGAVICERAEPGIRRCYANGTIGIFGFYHAQSAGTTWIDFYTLFDDATLLITTTGESEGSFRSLRILTQSRPSLTLEKLYEEHTLGVARIKKHSLNPTSIDGSLQGACRMIDLYLMRRLGGL
ncbi:MAG: hypothetical protein JNK74_05580 [Candidatus Hydrogenedentes bacterium]|nr:hypothetical protein [Candidatus Hydrogenedentota bacterium]